MNLINSHKKSLSAFVTTGWCRSANEAERKCLKRSVCLVGLVVCSVVSSIVGSIVGSIVCSVVGLVVCLSVGSK